MQGGGGERNQSGSGIGKQQARAGGRNCNAKAGGGGYDKKGCDEVRAPTLVKEHRRGCEELAAMPMDDDIASGIKGREARAEITGMRL